MRGKEKTSIKNEEESLIEECPSVAEVDANSTKAETHERKSVLKKFIQVLYDCLQKRPIEKRGENV